MKNFKQILSLISEAKLEPGGEDLGKLFGTKGKFSPQKGKKEKTYQARVNAGDIARMDPNINRPAGLEQELIRNNPSDARWKEPTFKQRTRGLKQGEPIKSAESGTGITPDEQEELKKWKKERPTIENEIINQAKKAKTKQKIQAIPFKNNGEISPHFKKISQGLSKSYSEYVNPKDYQDLNPQEISRLANNFVDNHFDNLANDIEKMHKIQNKGKGFPNAKKFGGFAKLQNIDIRNPEYHGIRTMTLQFEPFKTNHVNHTAELKILIDHLQKHTGHEWYVHHESGVNEVGKHKPLILATDIEHPDLHLNPYDGDNNDDDDDDGGSKKPKTPIQPRTPSLV